MSESFTHDLEECCRLIEMLEALAWRFRRKGKKEEEAACVTILSVLTEERERKNARHATDPSQFAGRRQPEI